MASQVIRIEAASSLPTIAIETDIDRLVISFPSAFIGADPNMGYDADTEALWAAIQADLKVRGWEWTGGAGMEEDGSGDVVVFARVAG